MRRRLIANNIIIRYLREQVSPQSYADSAQRAYSDWIRAEFSCYSCGLDNYWRQFLNQHLCGDALSITDWSRTAKRACLAERYNVEIEFTIFQLFKSKILFLNFFMYICILTDRQQKIFSNENVYSRWNVKISTVIAGYLI